MAAACPGSESFRCETAGFVTRSDADEWPTYAQFFRYRGVNRRRIRARAKGWRHVSGSNTLYRLKQGYQTQF